jgi:meso-butanediol dehydrogenase/(S,S)-butanediol dehydrogenase/diacetyl reductase
MTPHYRASKAAVISLTQTASFGLAPRITVNAVCPGIVDTEMWGQIDREWGLAENLEPGEAWKARTAAIPMGRPQTGADVADVVGFLCSPSSDYMTGQSINVDGGMSLS